MPQKQRTLRPGLADSPTTFLVMVTGNFTHIVQELHREYYYTIIPDEVKLNKKGEYV